MSHFPIYPAINKACTEASSSSSSLQLTYKRPSGMTSEFKAGLGRIHLPDCIVFFPLLSAMSNISQTSWGKYCKPDCPLYLNNGIPRKTRQSLQFVGVKFMLLSHGLKSLFDDSNRKTFCLGNSSISGDSVTSMIYLKSLWKSQ